jgi:hypothetical protein
MQFCEANSIVLIDRHDNMDVKLCTAFNRIIITQETVGQSVHHILVENVIIGESPSIKAFSREC